MTVKDLIVFADLGSRCDRGVLSHGARGVSAH
jgi:hypothetical protein